jgi:hypothetical protein
MVLAKLIALTTILKCISVVKQCRYALKITKLENPLSRDQHVVQTTSAALGIAVPSAIHAATTLIVPPALYASQSSQASPGIIVTALPKV